MNVKDPLEGTVLTEAAVGLKGQFSGMCKY